MNNTNKRTLTPLAAVAAAAFGLTAVTGCWDSTDDKSVEVDQVLANPEAYAGRTIELVGEVDSMTSPRIFRLEDSDFGGPTLLVVSNLEDNTLPSISEEDEVQVNGTVRRVTFAELEPELDWDLDPEIEIEIEDATLMVADHLAVLDDA